MGAWGTGPFDSDNALDFLDDLARRCAEHDEDTGELIPGSVQHTKVRAALRTALREITQIDNPAGLAGWRCEAAYAAAGLVAAARTGHDPEAPSHTRLFDAMQARADGHSLAAGADPLGLASHCGNLALLDPASADALTADAVAAVRSLGQATEWLQTWKDPDDVRDQLGRLEHALTHDPQAGPDGR